MADELVRVYRVRDVMEAEVIKDALQAEGITCFLDGEHQAGFTGVLPVTILVPNDQSERAKELIANHQHLPDDFDEVGEKDETDASEEE